MGRFLRKTFYTSEWKCNGVVFYKCSLIFLLGRIFSCVIIMFRFVTVVLIVFFFRPNNEKQTTFLFLFLNTCCFGKVMKIVHYIFFTVLSAIFISKLFKYVADFFFNAVFFFNRKKYINSSPLHIQYIFYIFFQSWHISFRTVQKQENIYTRRYKIRIVTDISD